MKKAFIMKIDQNILNAYNESKSNLESITKRFIDIITANIVVSNNLYYKIRLSDSSYERVKIFFFENKKAMENFNIYKTTNKENILFSISFDIKENEEIDYKLNFKSIFNNFKKDEIFIIEESFTFLKEIIKIIEVTDYNVFHTLFNEFKEEFKTFVKRNKEMKANKKAYQDYLHSLTFDRIMTLFSKDNNIANDIYEDVISAFYRDVTKQFVTIKRDFDKIIFRKIEVEGKNNQKLSLMYGGQRISKAKLKEEIKDDLILFNGDYFKSTQDVIDKLGIKDLPFYNESNTMNGFSLQYDIDEFYNFFKKYIIANEF